MLAVLILTGGVRAYMFECSLCGRWQLRASPVYVVQFVWLRNQGLNEVRMLSPKVQARKRQSQDLQPLNLFDPELAFLTIATLIL